MRLLVCFLMLSSSIFAQEVADSTAKLLDEVKVTAFESYRMPHTVAASVGFISKKQLAAYDNAPPLMALNALPGVRMEERSPGSYRLALRGSSVRSPFGVRNVKMYWNGIPLTDANGNTYFNALDFNSIQSIEVLKGPAGSVYGAGIGGVVSMNTNTAQVNINQTNKWDLSYSLGTFKNQNARLSYAYANKRNNTYLSFSHVSQDGFREHSKMQKNVFNWQNSWFISPVYQINITAFYSDHQYQTPGGLNLNQYEADSSQARPATAFTPGAAEQKAGIFQKLMFIGLNQQLQITDRWTADFVLFGNGLNLENPFITNYEFRNERTFGIRNKNKIKLSEGNFKSDFVFGTEMIVTKTNSEVFDNERGTKGKQQFTEELSADQQLAFAQLEAFFWHGFNVSLGVSLNTQRYKYERISDRPNSVIIEDLSDIPLIPRVALAKMFGNKTTLFASFAKGFSAPTSQEFITGYQSAASFVPLKAETANNWEMGIKTKHKALSFEANAYRLVMQNALVRSTLDNGDEIFRNAGLSTQQGLELMLNYRIKGLTKSQFNFLGSYNLNDYKYTDYVQNDQDFSGNFIPSVARSIFTLGFDWSHISGVFLRSQLYHAGSIYLNDANTAQAKPYTLWQARLGYSLLGKKFDKSIFVGSENMLNQTYSLGNDTNAFGGRYYNTAAPRTFHFGLQLSLHY